jgi:hypothetical protein
MQKRGMFFLTILTAFFFFHTARLGALNLDEPASQVGVFGAALLLSSIPAMNFNIKQPVSKEVFFGYGYDDHLEGKGEYIHQTLAVDFNYQYNRNNRFWRYFQFQLEPFVSFVSSPDDNAEIGCVFFIKYTVPWDFPLKPYVRGGSGVILLTQETKELSTMFNFASQIGCGVSCALPRVNISLEYRLRHISNAEIKQPNDGIDDRIWLVGIGGNF